MKQYDAVEIISKEIIDAGIVDAIFLKGSLARGEEDEYSNIDLTCIVKDNNFYRFLEERINLIQTYRPIVYYNFMNNSIDLIVVFDNGVCLTLTTLKIGDASFADDIAVVFDPNQLLSNFKKMPLSYSNEEISTLLDSFFLTTLEFFNAYMRKDFYYSFNLTSRLYNYLGIFLRIKFDPEYAKLGLKLFKNIDPYANEKFNEITKKLKVDSHLECVKLMYVLVDNYINNLPIKIAEYINFDFYNLVKMKIMSISQ